MELPLEKAEAIFGIKITAVIMLNDAHLRCAHPLCSTMGSILHTCAEGVMTSVSEYEEWICV